MKWYSLAASLFLAAGLAAGPGSSVGSGEEALDWPNWRGPEQNGISRETGLPEEWDFDGNNLLWKSTELASRSSPIVMDGKIYTLARSFPETKKEGEKVICADATTGKVLWENKFNVYLSDVPAERVAWGAVVGDPATKKIYAMGVCGLMQCLDGATGKTLWSHSLSEEFGLLSTYGGRTNVATIFEDLVIISAVMTNWGDLAIPAHRFIAFNKETGEIVWYNGTSLRPDDTTYSTPTFAVIGGQQAMVFGSGDGRVWAFQPRTGKPLWSYQLSLRGLNISPLVVGDTVYCGQSEEDSDDPTSMGALAAINGLTGEGDISKTGSIWRERKLMIGKSSPVLVDGILYAFDDSNAMYAIDAKTGKPVQRKTTLLGTIMRSSPVYADGRIYACTTSAWHVITPGKNGAKITHRLRFPVGEEIHGSPAISHGRIYLPTTDAMYCIGLKDAKPAATARPEPVKEPEISDKTPALVQVVPAEGLIKPGDKVQYRAYLFNAKGQKLGEAKYAKFSVSGGGEIGADGTFTAATDPVHAGVIVTADVEGVKGTARTRIVPPLPWSFDFNATPLVENPMSKRPEGEPPITWIGVRYRHKIREINGEKVMVKVTTIPKGTRSQSWMGPVDLHDYTIQAEVLGVKTKTEEGFKMPDAGVIAQRYTLDLMGNGQQLQIRSWTAQLENRFAVTVPFPWDPDTWYVLKFRAETDGEKAVLKGKVWKKGDPEPSEWTVSGTDEVGNLEGSPGLFGNATGAEVFYDNITVTPNQ